MQKVRIDRLLVKQGKARGRDHAKDLIKEKKVTINKKLVLKSSEMVQESVEPIVANLDEYVGRGATKLKTFLDQVDLELNHITIADIGASTGGFTDYLLKSGAKKSYCIDIGADQLHQNLRDNEKVVVLDKVNIKNSIELPELVDLCVVDLSFISLKLVMTNILKLLRPKGMAVLLFKPQFEVGKQNLGKKGLVKEERVALAALDKFKKYLIGLNIEILFSAPCGLKGQQGNQEYFLLLQR